MRYLLVFLFVAIATVQVLCAQSLPQRLSGLITDSTGIALPFASVGVVNSPVGTVADQAGRFTLYLTNPAMSTDTVRLSLVGYQSVSRTVSDLSTQLRTDSVVILAFRPTRLAEVTVRSAQWRVRQTGNTNTTTRMKTNFALAGKPRQNLGAQIGRVFRVPKRGAFLEEFRFYISANNFDSTRFRINIMSLLRNHPDSSLLQRPVYVTLRAKQTGWVTVDLRPYNVFAADNVAVGVEWVDYGGKGNYLGIPITMPSVGAVHLYKYGSQSRWKAYGQMSACMELSLLCVP